MVGLVPKKGKQYPPSAGLFHRLLRGLDGHEDRIDPRQDLRIVKRHERPSVPSERSITHPKYFHTEQSGSSIQCRGNLFASRPLLTKHKVFEKQHSQSWH
jgi:hypothetical protein